jgi:hypothetical protein
MKRKSLLLRADQRAVPSGGLKGTAFGSIVTEPLEEK